MSRSPLIRLHYRPDSIIARKDSASEFSNNPTLASPRAVRTGAPRRDQVPTRWREVWQPSQSARGHPRHSSLRASDGGRSAGENWDDSTLIWRGKCCEACSHPDQNPGCDDCRKLARLPAERVDRPLRSLNSLRLATVLVLTRTGRDPLSPARTPPSGRRRFSGRCFAAEPAGCPVHPHPPILISTAGAAALPGWRPPGAFH